ASLGSWSPRLGTRSARMGAGLVDDLCDGHRAATLALAFVGGFHEGEDLDRFVGGDWRLAALEEIDGLDHQRRRAAIVAEGGDPLGSEDGAAELVRGLAVPAEGADPAALPHADCHIRPVGVGAGDRLAAGPHDRVKALDAVDAVPEEVGVVLLDLAW